MSQDAANEPDSLSAAVVVLEDEGHNTEMDRPLPPRRVQRQTHIPPNPLATQSPSVSRSIRETLPEEDVLRFAAVGDLANPLKVASSPEKSQSGGATAENMVDEPERPVPSRFPKVSSTRRPRKRKGERHRPVAPAPRDNQRWNQPQSAVPSPVEVYQTGHNAAPSPPPQQHHYYEDPYAPPAMAAPTQPQQYDPNYGQYVPVPQQTPPPVTVAPEVAPAKPRLRRRLRPKPRRSVEREAPRAEPTPAQLEELRRRRREEERKEKMELLHRLYMYEKRGFKIPGRYSMDSNIDELRFEVAKFKNEESATNAVKWYKMIMMMGIGVVETLNTKFDPFGIKFKGVYGHMAEKRDDFDGAFMRLHDKWSTKSHIEPEMELFFGIFGGMFMYHLQNTMASGGAGAGGGLGFLGNMLGSAMGMGSPSAATTPRNTPQNYGQNAPQPQSQPMTNMPFLFQNQPAAAYRQPYPSMPQYPNMPPQQQAPPQYSNVPPQQQRQTNANSPAARVMRPPAMGMGGMMGGMDGMASFLPMMMGGGPGNDDDDGPIPTDAPIPEFVGGGYHRDDTSSVQLPNQKQQSQRRQIPSPRESSTRRKTQTRQSSRTQTSSERQKKKKASTSPAATQRREIVL